MPSPPLKIKDNVDLVGLSVPLVLLKVLMPSKDSDLNLSLNNSWWIALPNTETRDATVDSWTPPSNSSKTTESPSKPTILTRLLTRNANKPPVRTN